MFLAILTSRHQAIDFGRSLPTKLFIDLTALFISIASVLVSFCGGHFFVLKNVLKDAKVAEYVVAVIPVLVFAIAQFPLYFKLILATIKKVPERGFMVTIGGEDRGNSTGVYADDGDIKQVLGEKYGNISVSELKEKNKELFDDLMESDICMTVRLQIVYGRLSIRSVRSAFEESVGTRLQKFGGADNKELLQRFTSQFKDEYKIPRGSIIDLSREQGNVIRTARKAIHGQVIKNGIDPNMHLWVSLINFYAKCHVFNFACQVLDEMFKRDVVSWTAMISRLVADGYGNDYIYLFSEMRNEGIRPNEFSLATCLRVGSICLDLEFRKQVHAEVIKLGFFSDIYVGSALVDLYAKCGEMEYADKVFFCMPKQNDVSWNALLNGYAQMGNEKNVLWDDEVKNEV
ncbi:Fatty-acid-binding protein 1 [Camellia lanceoleosa]|uniref:Fatty-acid-binding protein 1 n=1 Tax=Camellia lanceoleosa TaxID=1840588 RepID=A0ACC0F3S6_9ERIC|nr:Fatty-acid-binding protein 1 [Camellia lanceoleosa]